MKLRNKQGQYTNPHLLFNSYVLKATIILFTVLGLLLTINVLIEKRVEFKLHNTETWSFPISISFNKIRTVTPREPQEVLSPLAEEVVTEIPSDLSDTEQIILDVFGERDFAVARAIAKSESGLNPEAWNANTNGTLDIGLFQINSIHWDKCGGMANLLDPLENAKCAKMIKDDSGWYPWVVYQIGSFKENL